MDTQIRHSWPSWTLGTRAAHAKFGGGVILGGIAPVDKRLRLIKNPSPTISPRAISGTKSERRSAAINPTTAKIRLPGMRS